MEKGDEWYHEQKYGRKKGVGGRRAGAWDMMTQMMPSSDGN